jgi:ribosome-binding factor A
LENDCLPKKGIGDCMRKNSIKNTRINGEVQKELSILISREIKDPRIHPMTSVVHVEVAPDLKTAKVYISVMGDDLSKKSTLQGLKSAASFMRGQLAKSLNLRNTPELTFVIDNSIEYGVHMSKLIDEVNKNVVVDETGDDYYDDEQEDDEDSEDLTEEEDR